ncbi:11S globulin seed storage protein 2-like [Euphorbia lathyris]|uniref:11S globulin seed storage protein 2-like n=1 Tax=Euphorbia lathyris TaxID=212925 RepID=UPI0033138FA4
MELNSGKLPQHQPGMDTHTRTTTKLVSVCLLLLSLIAASADARRPVMQFEGRSSRMMAKQCQIQRFTTAQPSHKIESDGGMIEMWDPMEDHFQCAGAAAMRITIRPKSLSLPKFFPSPRLIYVIQGRGMVGISCPGCPETYQMGGSESEERHQRIHRIRRGDIIAIPHGHAHWCYNDGNEDLVAVSVLDLDNKNNQLDQSFRAFMLAGGQSSRQDPSERSRQGLERMLQDTFQNVMSGLDDEILAESFSVPTEVIRKMKQNDDMGLIVKCNEDMSMIKPDEEEAEQMRRNDDHNGIEETICSSKIRYNMETMREADYYTRHAGKINVLNEQKLPILSSLDMGAERGTLMPDAMYTPHWSMTDMRMVYALRGDIQLQMVDDNGNTVMEERVKEGDMFIIPQFYVVVAKAGSDGFDYITFKTSSMSMQMPMAGSTSMMRAMPVDVIVNSYQVSPSQAMKLKMNRDREAVVFTPTTRMSRS